MRFLSSRWLKIAISVGLLTLLLTSIDPRVFLQQILSVRPEYFLGALLGYLLGQVLSAYKWRLLAQPFGFDQPFRVFTVYYFVGMYLNLFAPSTIAGDLGRGLLLSERKGSIGRALQSVLADRVSGLIVLLWLSAAVFLLFNPTVLPVALRYGIIASALLTIVGWWLLPRLVPVWFSPRQRLYRLVEKVVLPYRSRSGLVARACGLSFLFHLFQLSLQALLAYALGIAVPFWYLALFIPLINIFSALPLSFNGIGVREGGYVAFLTLIGVSTAEALAFGVLWTTLTFAAGLFGGLVFLLSPEARFSFRRAEAMTREPSREVTVGALRKTSGG